jgi:hypothetical protein
VKPSEIVTAIVAVYGAALSTVVAVRQIFGERVRVKVTVKKNMQMVGDPRYQDMTLVLLTVTNIGRRPVTITTFGTIPLHPHPGLVAIDTQPRLPCEITEGNYITSMWPQADLDFSTIDYWAAWDSHGRMYRLQEAPRLSHWKSVVQRKRSLRKRKK